MSPRSRSYLKTTSSQFLTSTNCPTRHGSKQCLSRGRTIGSDLRWDRRRRRPWHAGHPTHRRRSSKSLSQIQVASRLRHFGSGSLPSIPGRIEPAQRTSYNLAEGVLPRSECVGDAIGPFVSMLADLTAYVVDTLYADALCLQAYHPVYSHANKVETTWEKSMIQTTKLRSGSTYETVVHLHYTKIPYCPAWNSTG
jgi:hypothetical protein